MIKINLLHNDLTMPAARERTGEEKVVSTGKTIELEAKKSTRRLFLMVIFLVLLIAGAVGLYNQRYEVVAFVEPYTGPLNILPPREEAGPSAEVMEEMRLEKIRQQYMANTFRIQRRDLLFLTRVDSLKNTKSRIQMASVTLDNDNSFILELFGKSESDLVEYTKIFLDYKAIDELKLQDVRRSKEMPGFGFQRTLQGSLRVPAFDEADTLKTNFIDLEKAKKKMKLLAKEDTLKTDEAGKMTTSNGVVMTTHSGKFLFEGKVDRFLRFARKLNRMSLNIEFTKYSITYVPEGDKKKADKKKQKPDSVIMDYNILIPAKVTTVSK
jgi:hypothetical protein